jgi:hypothetical protein
MKVSTAREDEIIGVCWQRAVAMRSPSLASLSNNRVDDPKLLVARSIESNRQSTKLIR